MMEDLITAIYTTPIIDNHAHPLVLPAAADKYPFLSITTEARGEATRATRSSLSHLRAVQQLSGVLGCQPTWEALLQAIDIEKAKPNHVWEKRCFEGIETILMDDGLDGQSDEVCRYKAHSRFTRGACKRIVRIEKVAERIFDELYKRPQLSAMEISYKMREQFEEAIKNALDDPTVAAFKTVICYRTGLDLPPLIAPGEVRASVMNQQVQQGRDDGSRIQKLDGLPLNAWLVHKTAQLISHSSAARKKPLQFHSGLANNDITLTKSSPSYLQGLIKKYPNVPIILLYASYPWTREAGYLAMVYANVYADIGKVCPSLSKDGQQRVVREILELCPSEKIVWSTDGHWFPESFLLAIMQVREALEKVLTDYVSDGSLSVPQAIRAVQDILFRNANDLYDLRLPMIPFPSPTPSLSRFGDDHKTLTRFIAKHPKTKFLRLQYIDYTSTSRLRIIPVKRALSVLENSKTLSIGISSSALGILQNDTMVSGVTATGEYRLCADFSSLCAGPHPGYAMVQGDFHEIDNRPSEICPRSLLRDAVDIAQSQQGLEFLAGFEIEVVFLSRFSGVNSTPTEPGGHAWSSARALHGKRLLEMLGVIYDTLCEAGIDLEQWHPESATGQYEFVLPRRPPLEACDMVIQAREIITTVAATYNIRATLHPKPFPDMAGTASHLHMSLVGPDGHDADTYMHFWAGIMRHLPAIIAFSYSNPASYERLADSCMAGGRWVTWGTQNRETALRKIRESHYEIKVLDGLANVYLVMVALIAAGTKGVLDGEDMVWQDCDADPATLTDETRHKLHIDTMLPHDLDAALDALKSDDVMVELMGEDLVTRYVAIKEAELDLMRDMTDEERTGWLIERY